MKWPSRISISIAIALCTARAWAQFDGIEVTLTPVARAYCHVLRFPQGWSPAKFDQRTHEPLLFGTEGSDLEFRVEGVLSTTFLVAGFNEVVGNNNYTLNRYKVDLANPSVPVLPASRKAWEDAAVVQFTRKSAFPTAGILVNGKELELNGHQFVKSGQVWYQYGGALLSPDAAWVVLQSSVPNKNDSSERVFFDFFNADIGRKLFTLEGIYSSLHTGEYADLIFAKTGWVTERFFIIPLGKKLDRCLVCDFGKGTSDNGAKQ